MHETIKIILANQKPLFGEKLKLLLKNSYLNNTILEIDKAGVLPALIESHLPDILLLDTDLTNQPFKLINSLSNLFPHLKMIALVGKFDVQTQVSYLIAGVNSIISRDCNPETLLLAIKKTHEKGFFLPPSLHDRQANVSTAKQEEFHEFNHRELDIIKRVCEGETNRQIASELKISLSTVDFYKGKIYSKCNCHNATGLIKFAIKNGLVNIG